MEVFSNFTVFTSTDEEIVVNCALFAKFTKISSLQHFPRHGNAQCKNEKLKCSMRWRLDVFAQSKGNESYHLSVVYHVLYSVIVLNCLVEQILSLHNNICHIDNS